MESSTPPDQIPFLTDEQIIKRLEQTEYTLLSIQTMAGSAARSVAELKQLLEPRKAA